MKTKTKKVYYCDFCNKHSLRPLRKHEKHCTANPNRDCRICGRESILPLIYKYEKQMEINEDKMSIVRSPKLEDIRNDVDNCPMCIFAIIRICKLIQYPYQRLDFDFKKELQNYWDEKNAELTPGEY